MRPGGSARRRSACRSVTLFTLLATGGCTSAPAQNIAGSFFPSWLLCAAGGALGAVATRAALGATGIGTGVPFPLLTYPAIAGSITLALWLVLFGH